MVLEPAPEVTYSLSTFEGTNEQNLGTYSTYSTPPPPSIHKLRPEATTEPAGWSASCLFPPRIPGNTALSTVQASFAPSSAPFPNLRVPPSLSPAHSQEQSVCCSRTVPTYCAYCAVRVRVWIRGESKRAGGRPSFPRRSTVDATIDRFPAVRRFSRTNDRTRT